MFDDQNPDPKPGDDGYKEKRNELFGDLDDESTENRSETVESLRQERDALTAQIRELSRELLASRREGLSLADQAAEARKTLQHAENKFREDRKFAVQDFVEEMLPVVDNLERALGAFQTKQRETDPKFGKLAEGVEKTLGQLKAVFNKFGVKEINPMDQAFDEKKHEVITTQARADTDPETVIHVAQKGYEIEGRIIRPAKVIVTPRQD